MNHELRQRRVQRVRHELRRREVDVVRSALISPGFVSVTFGGDALESFLSASFDDHIKFIIENENGEKVARDYTPRHFDAQKRELTIEFALHGEGDAASWARQASIGNTAMIGGPRGSMIIPMDYDWHLLAGDATALPAIHRRLEELPAGSRAMVIVQLDEAVDRRAFSTLAQLDLRWVTTPDELIATVRELSLPAGEGFVWGAGEASMMKRVRAIMADEKGHPKDAMRIAAYWRQGQSSFHEELSQPAAPSPDTE